MRIHNNQGLALFFSLLVVTVLIAVGSAFIGGTVSEKSVISREIDNNQAFYMADGGSQIGLQKLNNLINTELQNVINNLSPQTVTTAAQGYVTSNDGLGLLLAYVQENGQTVLTQNGDEAVYTGTQTTVNGTNYQYTIYISEKTDPSSVTSESWDFPYFYRVEAVGTADGVSKTINLHGDFTVRVQRGTFARYALFTNNHTTQSGGTVWFTNNTYFDGPLHTNQRFSFAFNPSGTFDGAVEQYYSWVRFYNNGWTVLLQDDHNGTRDVPVFNQSFTREGDHEPLSTSGDQSDMENEATNSSSYGSNGIYLPNSGGALTGGIYVKGDADVSLSVDGSDRAVYTITQSSTTKTVTVDLAANQTIVDDGTTQTTYNSIPDGSSDVGTLLYVDGDIDSLSGTVQKDTQLTIASDDDVVIQGDILYSDYTAGSGTPGTSGYVPPNANNATNLLGVVSWNGDVRIGTSAPDDVEIHSTLLAADGVFTVDSYSSQSIGPRGQATLLGGAITDYYGAFGTFSGSTGNQLSGYGRNFVYDQRMQQNQSPPYYPTIQTFVAFTNDITDKVSWQEGN